MSAGGTKSESAPVYPKWAKPYIKQGLQESQSLYMNRTAPPSLYVAMDPRRRQFLEGYGQSGIIDPALQGYGATLRGDYLGGSPYQSQVLDRALNAVRANVGGEFATGGRYGSGQWAASLADAMTGTSAQYLDRNYQMERDRMTEAQLNADRALGLGEYVGSAFEEDQAAKLEEQYRQWRAPQEALNEYLAQVYGNPAVQRPGTRTTSEKDLNWVDILSGLLGCWVAEELFGVDHPKTLAARGFCYAHWDHPLVRLYRKHGIAWAAFLKRHRWARPLARPIWELLAHLGERGGHRAPARRAA